jgi:hypothetical protein
MSPILETVSEFATEPAALAISYPVIMLVCAALLRKQES